MKFLNKFWNWLKGSDQSDQVAVGCQTDCCCKADPEPTVASPEVVSFYANDAVETTVAEPKRPRKRNKPSNKAPT